MNIKKILFSLIRLEICGTPVSYEIINAIDADVLIALYELSSAHDMAHIIASALSKVGKLGEDEISKKFKNKAFLAVYRIERINFELQRICKTLEDAKIKFMPLKGAVIRKLYPEEWMRTSCDIDILVHEEDLDKTASLLKEKLNYLSDGTVHYHDMSLFSPSGVHLELHHNIKEKMKKNDVMLEKVWEHCIVADGKKYQCIQTNEYLIFHIIAHMSYHFLRGGCGIRPIIDLWILDHIKDVDQYKLNCFLEQCGLMKFAEKVRKLSRVWLENEMPDDVTERIQEYILNGGVYGNFENKLKIINRKKYGKIRYLLSKAFISYDAIKNQYPILKKHRYLTPIMQVRRLFRLMFFGVAHQSIKELSNFSDITRNEADDVRQLLEEIGL